MRIGLVDIDSKIPNLALMKLSAYHKAKGDHVELTMPIFAESFDLVYSSKVFTWTELPALPPNAVIGGTGYDLKIVLPEEVENICPDYLLYPGMDYSLGFLTRGCIRKCPWCLVPEKEGKLRAAADIEDFLRHDKAILMDNNVLASDWGIKQIEKIARLGVRVDFNQGLDARLIDDTVAKLLAKVKWLAPVRLACDTLEMIPDIQKAVEALRWHNVTPRRYSCYVMVKDDLDDALQRIRFLKGLDVDPFVQPYISQNGEQPPKIQKHLARWADLKQIYNRCTWDEYLGDSKRDREQRKRSREA